MQEAVLSAVFWTIKERGSTADLTGEKDQEQILSSSPTRPKKVFSGFPKTIGSQPHPLLFF